MGMLAEPRVKGRHLRAKWEAVRRTRETLANQISTGSDATIGLGMARRLMENLGWKEGQGLGASNQGLAEPVKLHQNFDSRGVGYTAKRGVEQEHHAAHFQKFESVLSALSAAHSKENNDAVSTKLDSENGVRADGGGDENRPKRSRNHLHYHKFARAKDVSNYSRHDLECVIGAKAHALYSDVLKEGQLESSDKFTVSEFSSTDYFSGLQETGSNRTSEDDTDMRPGFEAGSPRTEKEDAKEFNDVVQKNFQKSVSNSYAACFVAADSVLPLEARDEEGLPEDNGGVDVERISKKKKKKKSKKSEVSENPCSAVPFDGKQELIESELVTEEKENQAKLDIKVESAAVDNHEVAECEGTMQVANDVSSLVPKKKKKKKKHLEEKDLSCHHEEATFLTAEESRTEMNSSSSVEGKEKSKVRITDIESVETSSASADGAGNALWSKFAHLYATSFVKGEVIPGSIESSAELPTSDTAVEETNEKRRKKKSKRKGKEMGVDEAGMNTDVREPGEKLNSKCSDDAESVSKVDGESDSSKSLKKKRKSNAVEIVDACADDAESNLRKEDEAAEENTVTTDISVDHTVVKKKKKNKRKNLEVRKESNGSITEDCGDNNAGNTSCNDGFETENQLVVATEKKKKSERGSAQKKDEEIVKESFVVKNDQQDSGNSKSNKKEKKLRDLGCASTSETVAEADGEMLLEEKSVGEYTEGQLKKKKKKKSSRSLETVASNELEEACVSLEESISREEKKRSKKRKRQETDADEEKSVVEDLEIKQKKKKQKNTFES